MWSPGAASTVTADLHRTYLHLSNSTNTQTPTNGRASIHGYPSTIPSHPRPSIPPSHLAGLAPFHPIPSPRLIPSLPFPPRHKSTPSHVASSIDSIPCVRAHSPHTSPSAWGCAWCTRPPARAARIASRVVLPSYTVLPSILPSTPSSTDAWAWIASADACRSHVSVGRRHSWMHVQPASVPPASGAGGGEGRMTMDLE